MPEKHITEEQLERIERKAFWIFLIGILLVGLYLRQF